MNLLSHLYRQERLKGLSLGVSMVALSALLSACGQSTEKQTEQSNPVEKTTKVMHADVSAKSSSKKVQEVSPEVTAKIKASLAKLNPNISPLKIIHSQLPGFYEVLTSSDVIYIDKDIKFVMPGPVFNVSGDAPTNITDASKSLIDEMQRPARAKLVNTVTDKDAVVFKAKNEKYVVNVFTDIDCGYCRKLHQDMQGYLDAGITVRYLAFPRAGVNSGSYNKLVSIWCASDRNKAMSDAKLHGKVVDAKCDNPISAQYKISQDIGLGGTPSIILKDGKLFPGYMPPQNLVQALEQHYKH